MVDKAIAPYKGRSYKDIKQTLVKEVSESATSDSESFKSFYSMET